MSSPQLPVELSRRTLLKTGLIGFALVSVGSAALLLQSGKSHTGTLSTFTPAEAGTLAALARRLCPSDGPGAPGADGLDLVTLLDQTLAPLDDELKQQLKLGLTLFDNAFTGALFGERVRPFSQLDGTAQDAVIRNWQTSSVAFRRTLMRGLSSLVMSVYWGDPRTWTRIGYAGPPDATALRATYADNLVDLDSLRAQGPAKET
ncbi:MAG TPA: gluconate 2-dehydrogenase subunit 3 family protein [Polyangiales bacterium]